MDNKYLQGEAIYAPLNNDGDLEKFHGKLRGKVVLSMPSKQLTMIIEPLGHRLTDVELEARATSADPSRLANPFRPPTATGQPPTPEEREKQAQFRKKVNQYLRDEGALAVLQYGYNGDGGTVFAAAGGSRDVKDPVPPPMIAVNGFSDPCNTFSALTTSPSINNPNTFLSAGKYFAITAVEACAR